MKKTLVIVAAVLALSLSGCTAASTAAPDRLFGTVDELKVAFEEAGGVCASPTPDLPYTSPAQGIICADGSALYTFASAQGLENVFDVLRSEETVSMVVGGNWIVATPDAKAVQIGLGGVLVTQ